MLFRSTAGKLRQVVCSASLTMDDGQVVSLRASVGAAGTMTASMEDLETLLDLADRRMYVDKLGKRKRDV